MLVKKLINWTMGMLLAVCPIVVNGQDSYDYKDAIYNPYKVESPTNLKSNFDRSRAITTIGFYTASVALNAMGDAYNDEGNKALGHSLNALSIASLLVEPIITEPEREEWLSRIASYTFIRYGTFDYIYNATRGLPLTYIGNSSISDKIMRKFKAPDNFFVIPKTLSLTVGFAIPLNHFIK